MHKGKNRTLVKNHSNADEELAAKLLTEVTVYARFAQHIAWEMQYAFNGLRLLGIDCDKMIDKKNKLFDLSSDMPVLLQRRYDSYVDEDDVCDKQDHLIKYIYNDLADLEELDRIVRDKAKRLYEKFPCNFEHKFDTDDDYKIEAKEDYVGEGKLDEFLEMYEIDKRPKEEET